MHAVAQWEREKNNSSTQGSTEKGAALPSTSTENDSFALDEPQALLDSIQADAIPEPQIRGIENIRTLLGAALQDLANKESGDAA